MDPDVRTAWEIVSVALGVIYVILAARPHVACWIFGIVGSAITVVLMADAKLYSDAILNVAYVILGVWGWWSWNGAADDRPVDRLPSAQLAGGAALAALVGLGVGGAMGAWTDAALPLLDAQVLTFSLFATWMTARKAVESWLFWVVIDAVAAGLFASRGLYGFAALMGVYTGIAAVGWWRWRGLAAATAAA